MKTKHELALKLIDTEGRCFGLVASCFSCPIGKGWEEHTNSNGFWCGFNHAARLAWAKEYTKGEVIGNIYENPELAKGAK